MDEAFSHATSAASDLTPPVIVLGMHRSGTSLLAGTLQSGGVYLGDVNTSAPHNKKGNREHEALRAVHDAMLAKAGYSWRSPPDGPLVWDAEDVRQVRSVLSAFRNKPSWGFKDPRAIWLIEGYRDLFPSAELIAIIREPGAVAASLAARPGDLFMSPEQGFDLWRKTNMKLLSLWRQHRFPVLRFSDLGVLDPLFSGPLRRILRHDGAFDSGTTFFDSDLVHQSGSALPVPPACHELWEDLLDACRTS